MQSIAWLAGMACLCLGVACAKPKLAPWPETLQAAVSHRRLAIAEGERPDFAAGFQDGATMVHNALQAGVRPFRPVQGEVASPLRSLGRLPEGVAVLEAGLAPEVDPATGLFLFPLGTANSSAFAKGQIEGFAWALGAVGTSLVRPVPKLAQPVAWVPWQKIQDAGIRTGNRVVALRWHPGLLAWGVAEQGFPVVRRWREWRSSEAPVWAGLSQDALWVETANAQVLAIDLQSGGILEVQPAPAHPAAERSDWERRREAEQQEYRTPEFRKELTRLRAAAEAGQVPTQLALAKRLAGMSAEADLEAYGWYQKAAASGSAEAMLAVGVWLYHGRAVPADRPLARQWLARASAAGLKEAAGVLELLVQGEAESPAGRP